MERGGDSRAQSVVQLREWLELLRGKKCWSIVAGRPNGSQIKLDFGQPVPRRHLVRNPFLGADQRDQEGEFDLFVQCAWRLEHDQMIVCGSTDDDRNDGPIVTGLSKLTDKTVLQVELSDPVPDLTIRLGDGFVLRLFCDQTNLEQGGDNYSFRSGDTILAVGPRGAITSEIRQSN